jgi:hypothetical protein
MDTAGSGKGPAVLCSPDTLDGQYGESSDDGAEPGDRVQHAVAAATQRQDDRRDRRRDGKGKRAGDVEHAEILSHVAFAGQHIHHQRQVDGQYTPKPSPAMAIPTRKPLKRAGCNQ